MRTSALRVALAALALILAAAARAQDEPAPALLDGLTLVGVDRLSESDLRAFMLTEVRPGWRFWQTPPRFDETTLAADMNRIALFYRERGYYEAKASYELSWDESHSRARAVVTVHEGEPVRLGHWSIEIEEDRPITGAWREHLLDDLPLREGQIFTLEAYRDARTRVLDRLADHGHPDAALSGGGDVNLATHTAVVQWTIRPGRVVQFGEVKIEGLERVDEALVRRELTFHSGERYSEEELRTSQQQISDLGLFRSVLLLPSVGPEAADERPAAASEPKPTRDLRLVLEERPPRSLRLGLGYGTEDRVRVQAGWLHRNIFGRADKLELRGRYSALGSEFEVSLREPRLPDPRTTLGVATRLRNETLPAYDALELRNTLSVERPLRRGWSGRAAYVTEWTSINDVAGGADVELDRPEGRFLLSYFELGVRRITTDDLISPTRGTWLELALEPSWRWIGSDVSYARGTLDARAYLPLGPTVLALRGLIGTVEAFGTSSTSDLPITKLFFAGGSTTVRGYGFQRLGPTDAEGKPLGGASLLTGSVELRVPLFSALAGAVFVDAGEISVDPWSWRPRDLQYSPGVGLRYRTPLGPIRLDVAFPIDPPSDVSRARLWISIGEAF